MIGGVWFGNRIEAGIIQSSKGIEFEDGLQHLYGFVSSNESF
jgi:hypothetical protein